MIDVKNTIFETIKDKIQKMRFLGQYDPITFKHILYLVLLDDIYDWSNYLDESQSIQKRLQELRTQFILDHGEFVVKMTSPNNFYINVNTPQTNHTWKRVWDAPDVIDLSNHDPFETEDGIYEGEYPKSFTPDQSCSVSITYYGGNQDVIKALTQNQDIYDIIDGERVYRGTNRKGAPNVDLNKLTICEKMNIHINRETGQMFFLNPDNCIWTPVRGQLLQAVNWIDIEDRPEVYNGISHTIIHDGENPENERFNVSLTKDGTPTSDLIVTDSRTSPDLNTDLEGIL